MPSPVAMSQNIPASVPNAPKSTRLMSDFKGLRKEIDALRKTMGSIEFLEKKFADLKIENGALQTNLHAFDKRAVELKFPEMLPITGTLNGETSAQLQAHEKGVYQAASDLVVANRKLRKELQEAVEVKRELTPPNENWDSVLKDHFAALASQPEKKSPAAVSDFKALKKDLETIDSKIPRIGFFEVKFAQLKDRNAALQTDLQEINKNRKISLEYPAMDTLQVALNGETIAKLEAREKTLYQTDEDLIRANRKLEGEIQEAIAIKRELTPPATLFWH